MPDTTPLDDFCPVCGDSQEWESCWQCLGEGGFHECGEDTCACADPDDLTEPCEECDGEGGYLVCLSAEKHPQEAP